MTAAQILDMTDKEIGTCAAGGYGVEKRKEIVAAIRELAARSDLRRRLLGSLTQ